MLVDSTLKHPLFVFGPDSRLGYVRFVPPATAGANPIPAQYLQVSSSLGGIVEGMGVVSVVPYATGKFQINCVQKGQAITPLAAHFVHSSSATVHTVYPTQISTTGSFEVEHRSAAALSNVVDQVVVTFVVRVGS